MAAGADVLRFLMNSIGSLKRTWKRMAGTEAIENADDALRKGFSLLRFRKGGQQAVENAGQAAGGGSKLFRGLFGFHKGDAGFEAKNTIGAVAEPLTEYAENVRNYRRLQGTAEGIMDQFDDSTQQVITDAAQKAKYAYANNDVQALREAKDKIFKYVSGLDNGSYKNQQLDLIRESGLGELLNARTMQRYNKSFSKLQGKLTQLGAEVDDVKGLTKWAENLSDSELAALKQVKPDTGLQFWGKSVGAGLRRGFVVGGVARASLPFWALYGTAKAFQVPTQLTEAATNELKRTGGL